MKRSILSALVLTAATAGAAMAQDATPAFVPGETFLATWDADGDGVVTLGEIETRRGELFTGFDIDGDGVLSAEELTNLAETREGMMQRPEGRGPSGAAAGGAADAMLARALDSDGNGQISRDEYVGFAGRWFARMDGNGDGKLEAGDFGPNGRRQAGGQGMMAQAQGMDMTGQGMMGQGPQGGGMGQGMGQGIGQGMGQGRGDGPMPGQGKGGARDCDHAQRGGQGWGQDSHGQGQGRMMQGQGGGQGRGMMDHDRMGGGMMGQGSMGQGMMGGQRGDMQGRMHGQMQQGPRDGMMGAMPGGMGPGGMGQGGMGPGGPGVPGGQRGMMGGMMGQGPAMAGPAPAAFQAFATGDGSLWLVDGRTGKVELCRATPAEDGGAGFKPVCVAVSDAPAE